MKKLLTYLLCVLLGPACTTTYYRTPIRQAVPSHYGDQASSIDAQIDKEKAKERAYENAYIANAYKAPVQELTATPVYKISDEMITRIKKLENQIADISEGHSQSINNLKRSLELQLATDQRFEKLLSRLSDSLYTVKPNESADDIAQQLLPKLESGQRLAILADHNPGLDLDALKTGDLLVKPSPAYQHLVLTINELDASAIAQTAPTDSALPTQEELPSQQEEKPKSENVNALELLSQRVNAIEKRPDIQSLQQEIAYLKDNYINKAQITPLIANYWVLRNELNRLTLHSQIAETPAQP